MKGIAWVPIAVGIFFIALILILSYAFTKVTILSRTVTDANVIFEGDEIETYARSLTNSVQLSTAQAIYDFYLNHNGAYWQFPLQPSQVPSPDSVESQVQGDFSGYMGAFFDGHKTFDDGLDNDMNFESSGASALDIGADRVDAKFSDKIVITKGPIDFASAKYTREFVPEASLDTVFGKIMDKIRELVSSNRIGNYVLDAIGTGAGTSASCKFPDRNGNTALKSYIDDDTAGNRVKQSQTETQGHMDFCSSDTVPKGCLATNPCPGGTPRAEPSPEEVYTNSHGQTFASGRSLIESHALDRLLCLESELDHESTEYTVAFDGDNLGVALGAHKIQTKAEIVSPSCSLANIGECAGFRTTACDWDSDGDPIKWWYFCHIIKKKTCDYDHFGAGEATIRYQEDGFVYGFARSGVPVADNIKVVFNARSGNKDLS